MLYVELSHQSLQVATVHTELYTDHYLDSGPAVSRFASMNIDIRVQQGHCPSFLPLHVPNASTIVLVRCQPPGMPACQTFLVHYQLYQGPAEYAMQVLHQLHFHMTQHSAHAASNFAFFGICYRYEDVVCEYLGARLGSLIQ